MLRPWYDRAAIPLLSKLFFPLGRAWAAAEVAGSDVAVFERESGGADRPSALVSRALATAARGRHDYDHAERAWQEAVFGSNDPGGEACAAAETHRERMAFRYMANRASFTALHALSPFPKLRVDIDGPATARARHGHRLTAPDAFGPLADVDTWEQSRSVSADLGTVRWLRGYASKANPTDRPWARVTVAPRGETRPVLILSHGISMEDEFWGMSTRAASAVLASGLSLIQPEGPGHGRRRPTGRYGGETVFGRGPVGLMDYFFDHVRELGALVGWARKNLGGPVAVGGISLGALSAQLVATAARHWPQSNRPDAVFLVTPSPDLRAVAFQGRLTGALGLVNALHHAGWTDTTVAEWLTLLEPQGEPCVPPDRIVCLLGEVDDVTPHATGLDLTRRWRVPTANVFSRPNGHFTTSIGLLRDHEPLVRLASVLG